MASRASVHIRRLDNIQHFVLMICNSLGIDDIHAFGVMCASRKRIDTTAFSSKGVEVNLFLAFLMG